MSVEPGFGGQSFIEGSTEKVAELRREIDRCGSQAVIEIDGGITLANAGAQFAAAVIFWWQEIQFSVQKIRPTPFTNCLMSDPCSAFRQAFANRKTRNTHP